MTYTIKLEGEKYTIIDDNGTLHFLRYGEPWPAADDLKHTNVVRSMAQRIEELETAIQTVLTGTACSWGRMDDGMVQGHADPVFTRLWEATLRRALEQKP